MNDSGLGGEAPWLAAWREWMGLAGKGFKSGPTVDAFQPRGAGFAQAYLVFGQTLQKFLRDGAYGDFTTRFVKAVERVVRPQAGQSIGDEFLNVFLHAAPTALLAAFPAANGATAWQHWSATLRTWIEQLLALPAIGPAREWQELLQDLQRAGLAEQGKRESVDAHYQQATHVALQRFADYLRDADGAPITTVRALYDAWIDHAEAAYAERVMSEAFSRDFAAWVDAGSDLRLALHAMGARLSTLFDTPQRDEIDALLKRQQQMQRELAALRAERDVSPTATQDSIPTPVSASQSLVEPAVVTSKAPRTRPARKPLTASPRAAKAAQALAANPPRAGASKAPKIKSTRGEFDIARILDGGK